MSNFTKKAIIESFIKLLNIRPISQITVKDIVEDCGINRNSFYYHFQDIPSLLEEVIISDADAIISEYPSIESIEQCLDVAVHFVLDRKKAALHIFNSSSREAYERNLMKVCEYVVRTYFNTAFPDSGVREDDKELIIRYYKCECYGQIIEWLNSGMKDEILLSYKRLCELKKGTAEEMIRRSAEK